MTQPPSPAPEPPSPFPAPPVIAPPADQRSHAVYFTTSRGRMYIRNPNRGVTLFPEHISWTYDGKEDGAPFKHIIEVNLQSGGNWREAINMCEIVFADRFKLIVVNCDEHGFSNDTQRAIYRDFVHDLHRRLAARSGSSITFNAGYKAGRYYVVMAAAIALGLICIGVPLVALLFTGEIKPLMLLIGGAYFIWPLGKMMQENAPRRYDPARPPQELMD